MRYRAFDTFTTLMGQNQALIQTGPERDLAVAPANAAGVLSRCEDLLTLEEHAEKIGRDMKMSPSQQNDLRKDLDLFASNGLLISEKELQALLIKRLGSGTAAPKSQRPITTIGIPTCNRPESLARGVQSYLQHVQTYSRACELVIVDDSRDPSMRQKNRDALVSLETAERPIRYAGLEQKEKWLQVLAHHAGVDPDIIRFGLFDAEKTGARSTGANRNALLLDQAGERCFSSDDDVICAAYRFKHEENSIQVGMTQNPMKMWFLHDQAEDLPDIQAMAGDVLALHERVLGRNVRDLLRDALAKKSAFDVSELNRRLLTQAAPNQPAARVTLSWMGLHGDPGLYQPFAYFNLKGQSLNRFLKDEASYKAALTVRRALRGVTQMTLGNSGVFQTTAYAFDHAELLPPFFPLFTNQDGFFAMLMSMFFKRDQFAYLPYFIDHVPEEVRAFNLDLSSYVTPSANFGSLLSVCIRACPEPEAIVEDSGPKLIRLGHYLAELGTLSVQEFRHFARPKLWANRGSNLMGLETTAQTLDAKAPYLASQIARYIEKTQEAMADEDYDLCCELTPGRSLEEAAALGQRLIRRFGEFLVAWPTLVSSAKELRTKNQFLALPLTK